jgi:hypothetical protein
MPGSPTFTAGWDQISSIGFSASGVGVTVRVTIPGAPNNSLWQFEVVRVLRIGLRLLSGNSVAANSRCPRPAGCAYIAAVRTKSARFLLRRAVIVGNQPLGDALNDLSDLFGFLNCSAINDGSYGCNGSYAVRFH